MSFFSCSILDLDAKNNVKIGWLFEKSFFLLLHYKQDTKNNGIKEWVFSLSGS